MNEFAENRVKGPVLSASYPTGSKTLQKVFIMEYSVGSF